MASTHAVLEHPMAISPPMTLLDMPSRPKDIWTRPPAHQIHRSATYTYLPSLLESSAGLQRSTRHSIGHDPIGVSDKAASQEVDRSRTKQPELSSPDTDPEPTTSDESSRVPIPPEKDDARPSEKHETANFDVISLPEKAHPKPGSLRSRSPSPTNTVKTGSSQDNASSLTSQTSSNSPPSPDIPERSHTVELRPKQLSMRRSMLSLRTTRPLSSFLKGPGADSANNEIVPRRKLPTSLSTDKLPTLMKSFPLERLRPIPRTKSSHNLQMLGRAAPRKKDELWNVFRTLDGDFHKFQSKPSAFKSNLVRSSLLPFLRTYAYHSSIKNLRPEDLDRRANIFNKWWTALLEMVDGGSSNYMLTATDRPIILDAITGIMTRPEWRTPPSSFAPLVEQQSQSGLNNNSRSTTSLESAGSEYLAESVHHNVKNIFVQNLILQTSIVVQKLSLRNAPASLVTFAGKALAYAFYFCAGIAEALVRLWSLSSNNIRCMADELGLMSLGVGTNTTTVASGFPPSLQSLQFSSLASTVRFLRRPPTPFLYVHKIDWRGPWLNRWSGRDSDLLFVFVKQWHILLEEFLPSDVSQQDRVRAPAFVLVYAQLMTVFQATIHRPVNQPHAVDPDKGPATTFDDVLAEADASAAALPHPAGNFTRHMAENRLIILLRDILSEKSPDQIRASRSLGTYFSKMLQAAARRISKFDHDACFSLCDFLEEAIYIFARYQVVNPSIPDLIDWGFWLEVCKEMSESHNTMSEMRLFAFIYSIWGTIVTDENRRKKLCLEWLLTPATFDRFFCHWCPMSRAYYMRLLCWRISRHTEERSELDKRILTTLMHRLRMVWSQVILLSKRAHKQNSMPPTIVPSLPAPGRRLLILRNDSQVPAPHLLTLEGLNTSPPFNLTINGKKNQSALSALANGIDQARSEASPPDSPSGGGKKLWGLLRMVRARGSQEDVVVPLKERENGRVGGGLRRIMSKESLMQDPASSSRPSSSRGSSNGQESSPGMSYQRNGAATDVRSLFRFSLEWVDKGPNVVSRGGRRLYPPKLPLPARTFLRATAPESLEPSLDELPLQENPKPMSGDKYVGRALSEWALVVNECQNFFDRRKSEGVVSDALVETPTLGVDCFRKSG
ncbi:MAG: hypothetical protein M1816_001506 [Peltula sp. TS41687]|nr:MAG: hypothetical protein M1816_001506 [Peltula sp. TS41687]